MPDSCPENSRAGNRDRHRPSPVSCPAVFYPRLAVLQQNHEWCNQSLDHKVVISSRNHHLARCCSGHGNRDSALKPTPMPPAARQRDSPDEWLTEGRDLWVGYCRRRRRPSGQWPRPSCVASQSAFPRVPPAKQPGPISRRTDYAARLRERKVDCRPPPLRHPPRRRAKAGYGVCGFAVDRNRASEWLFPHRARRQVFAAGGKKKAASHDPQKVYEYSKNAQWWGRPACLQSLIAGVPALRRVPTSSGNTAPRRRGLARGARCHTFAAGPWSPP